MKRVLIEELFILSFLEFFTQKFVEDFDEFVFEQNEENNDTMFSLFKRFSIVDLFEKIFHIRVNFELKFFILIFGL